MRRRAARTYRRAARSRRHEDLRRNPRHPRAQLARRRRHRADARPPGDADRRCAARQDQAGVHAARRHRRLRRRRQRREDLGDRQQARGQEVLPPLRLPRRHQGAHARRHARAPARRGHPPRREGHAAPQPAGAKAAHQAQGLRGSRPPARGAEADPDGDRRLMADDRTPADDETPQEPTAGEEQPVEEPAAERPAGEEQPAPEEPVAAADEPVAAAVEDEEDYEDEEPAPRVKPEIPGADLEVDIVMEGDQPRESAYDEDEEDEALPEEAEDVVPDDQPIAAVAIDLGAGARYRATGKRKTAVARVILKPGDGSYLINGRTLETFFPRATLQRTIRQPP